MPRHPQTEGTQHSQGFQPIEAESEGVFVCEDSQEKLGKRGKVGRNVGSFLSVAQAAVMLNVSERTARAWCESGRLPCVHKPYGNKTRYLISQSTIDILSRQIEVVSEEKKTLKRVIKPHSSYMAGWKRAMENGLLNGKVFSRHTVSSYEFYVKDFLERYPEITVESLKHRLSKMPVNAVAVKQMLYRAIVCFAKYLISEEALTIEFVESVKSLAPKYHKPPKRHTVNADDLESILVACETIEERAIVMLLATTGLRASEFCSLNVSDIALDAGVLIVRCGKGGKERKVGLNEAAVDILKLYMSKRRLTLKPNLFLRSDSKPWNAHNLYAMLKRLGEKAGVKVSPHALRRNFVTLNANKGRPLQMLQMACGHSDIKTTMSYCRTSEAEVIEAMKGW